MKSHFIFWPHRDAYNTNLNHSRVIQLEIIISMDVIFLYKNFNYYYVSLWFMLRCWCCYYYFSQSCDFQQCGMCDLQSLRSACAYVQSDQSLCLSLEYSMSVKLLTEHNLEFLSLKGGCTGSSESTLSKMPHCWKSHVMAYYQLFFFSFVVFISPLYCFDMSFTFL